MPPYLKNFFMDSDEGAGAGSDSAEGQEESQVPSDPKAAGKAFAEQRRRIKELETAQAETQKKIEEEAARREQEILRTFGIDRLDESNLEYARRNGFAALVDAHANQRVEALKSSQPKTHAAPPQDDTGDLFGGDEFDDNPGLKNVLSKVKQANESKIGELTDQVKQLTNLVQQQQFDSLMSRRDQLATDAAKKYPDVFLDGSGQPIGFQMDLLKTKLNGMGPNETVEQIVDRFAEGARGVMKVREEGIAKKREAATSRAPGTGMGTGLGLEPLPDLQKQYSGAATDREASDMAFSGLLADIQKARESGDL